MLEGGVAMGVTVAVCLLGFGVVPAWAALALVLALLVPYVGIVALAESHRLPLRRRRTLRRAMGERHRRRAPHGREALGAAVGDPAGGRRDRAREHRDGARVAAARRSHRYAARARRDAAARGAHEPAERVYRRPARSGPARLGARQRDDELEHDQPRRRRRRTGSVRRFRPPLLGAPRGRLVWLLVATGAAIALLARLGASARGGGAFLLASWTGFAVVQVVSGLIAPLTEPLRSAQFGAMSSAIL